MSLAPIVRLGQVMAGASAFKENNLNDTYRGSVFTGSAIETAIIKDLEPKELANEVLSAALGLLLGLPIPSPVIALATEDRLSAKKGPNFGSGRLVYASIDVAQPQVAMLYKGGGGRRVLDRLAAWRDLGRLYGFDALVANIDRHAGNVLFSGDKEVWLIDHGWCFTGPRWTELDLIPADKTLNSRLTEWLTPVLDNKRRQETAANATWIEQKFNDLDVPSLVIASRIESLLSNGDLQAVIQFLKDRCPHVPRLAARSLGISVMV